MTQKHNPMPNLDLHLGDDYLRLACESLGNFEMMYPSGKDKEAAQQIVKACNTYDELVDYLQRVYRLVPDSEGRFQREGLALLKKMKT